MIITESTKAFLFEINVRGYECDKVWHDAECTLMLDK